MSITPIQQLSKTWRSTENIVFGAFAKELESAYTGTFAWTMDKLLTVPGAKVRRKEWSAGGEHIRSDGAGQLTWEYGDVLLLEREDLAATDWTAELPEMEP